ncbi:MAG: helix-turn-helix domain-containing protein [Candidatus Cryptobacteroides sp.]
MFFVLTLCPTSGDHYKEIGYRLNFQSIPSFHKFFRNQTGMTPNEYRGSRTSDTD